MKRFGLVLIGAGLLLGGVGRAQDDAARAAAIADQQAAEERYSQLQTSVQGLLSAMADRDRRLQELESRISKLAAEQASAPKVDGNSVSRDDYNKLRDAVTELDRQRKADKAQILDDIEKLGRSLREAITTALRKVQTAPPTERERPQAQERPAPAANANQEGVYYTIEKGVKSLTAVITAHNAEFAKQGKKTTLKLVLDANPKLKPESMYIGQKIFIPVVPK